MKSTLIKTWKFSVYVVCSIFLKISKPNVMVMSIDETIDRMKKGCSIVRFGDAEFLIANGSEQSWYHKYSNKLSEELRNLLELENERSFLVCLPETISSMKNIVKGTKIYWTIHLAANIKVYRKLCKNNVLYGNSYVSRPYRIFKDKRKCEQWFAEILSLFEGKEFVLIEGKYSRMGVGNDLFKRAKNIQRILCPPKDAYDKYEEIKKASMSIPKEKIILLSIGPAGKPLAYELYKEGYTVWDLGHLDSEYEWFLMGTQEKVKLHNKHTAESLDVDEDIGECNDKEYLNSIIMEIY